MGSPDLRGGPAFASETLNLYIYRSAFDYLKMGYSSAMLVIFFVLILLVSLALVILRLGRKTFSARLFGVAIACGAMVAFLPAALGVIDARLHLALPPIWDATYKAFILAGLAE